MFSCNKGFHGSLIFSSENTVLIPNVRLALKIRARKIHSSLFWHSFNVECFVPGKVFQASSPKWINLLRLPEKLKWTNTLAYLSAASVTKKRKFYKTDTRAQSYKTFYGRNLRFFVIS